MMDKLSYICGSSLSEYYGIGADRDERFLKIILSEKTFLVPVKLTCTIIQLKLFLKFAYTVA